MSRGSLGTPEVSVVTGRSLLLYSVLLFIGVGLQSVFSSSLVLWGGQPDFLLTLALSVALITDSSLGAVAGFISGLMTAVVAGPTLGTFLVTRTIAAWAVGALRKRFVHAGVLVTLMGVGLGSILSGVLYGLSNPRIGLGHWFSLTVVGAVLNMIAALPVAVLLRWQSKSH